MATPACRQAGMLPIKCGASDWGLGTRKRQKQPNRGETMDEARVLKIAKRYGYFTNANRLSFLMLPVAVLGTIVMLYVYNSLTNGTLDVTTAKLASLIMAMLVVVLIGFIGVKIHYFRNYLVRKYQVGEVPLFVVVQKDKVKDKLLGQFSSVYAKHFGNDIIKADLPWHNSQSIMLSSGSNSSAEVNGKKFEVTFLFEYAIRVGHEISALQEYLNATAGAGDYRSMWKDKMEQWGARNQERLATRNQFDSIDDMERYFAAVGKGLEPCVSGLSENLELKDVILIVGSVDDGSYSVEKSIRYFQ